MKRLYINKIDLNSRLYNYFMEYTDFIDSTLPKNHFKLIRQ